MRARGAKLYSTRLHSDIWISHGAESSDEIRSMFSVVTHPCSLPLLTVANFLGKRSPLSAHCPKLRPRSQRLSSAPHSWRTPLLAHPLQPAARVAGNQLGQSRMGQQGSQGHRGPTGMTCSLENLEQMVKDHSFSSRHCCFTLTPGAFGNVWNISFLIVTMGKFFCGESVF